MLVEHLLNIVKELKKTKETRNSKNIYRNELDKACFAHDATYSESKDLVKRTISDKIELIKLQEIPDMMNIKGY